MSQLLPFKLFNDELLPIKDLPPFVFKSFSYKQDEILRAIRHLYCPGGFECDLTFGNGSFWEEIPAPKYRFDITPLLPGVVKADSKKVPLPKESLRNLVFDPPFLCDVKSGRSHSKGDMVMASRFGGYPYYPDLEKHYIGTIKDAHRLLENKGIMVFKCQDIIFNHKLHCTHSRVIQWAEETGFRLADLFILVAKSRLPSRSDGKQKHARIFHSYFLVLQKIKPFKG